jgi:hypothetical protein
MEFTVERESDEGWEAVAAAIYATDAAQAVTRTCNDAGTYRAAPLGTSGIHEHFVVPTWGPPEPVEPGLA